MESSDSERNIFITLEEQRELTIDVALYEYDGSFQEGARLFSYLSQSV